MSAPSTLRAPLLSPPFEADDEETGEEERVVCSSPCDQEIDARPGRELQLAHRGVSIGPPLDLEGHGTSVNITVDRLPGRAQLIFGLVLLGVGAASIPAGAGMAVAGNDARRMVALALRRTDRVSCDRPGPRGRPRDPAPDLRRDDRRHHRSALNG